MKNNKKRGFTLVELLVVIAILAILATVAVVGYTSFITRAERSNDEAIANQMNDYWIALRADSQSKWYGEKITVDNINDIVAEMVEKGNFSLVNQAENCNFYYDLKEEKFVVLNLDEAVGHSVIPEGWIRAFRMFAGAEEPESYPVRPGNSFTKNNRYFILTQGDAGIIGEIVKAFYDLNTLEEGTGLSGKFFALSEKVQGLPSELSGIKSIFNSAIFVTPEGNFVADVNGNHTILLVQGNVDRISNTKTDANGTVYVGTDIGYMLAADGQPMTIYIPKDTRLPANSLTVSGVTPGNVVIKINANTWSEVVDYLDAGFTTPGVIVEVGDGRYVIDGNSIYDYDSENTEDGKGTQEDIALKYHNPMESFNVELNIEGAKKMHNITGSNTGYIALDWKTFSLDLIDSSVIGMVPSEDISNRDVNWTVHPDSAEYVTVSNGVFTLNQNKILADGVDTVYVVATANVDKEGYISTLEDKYDVNNCATQTFSLEVVRLTGATLTLANKPWADKATLIYDSEDTDAETYGVVIDGEPTYSDNKISEIELDKAITLQLVNGSGFTIDGTNLITNAAGTGKLKVSIGNEALTYVSYETTATIFDASAFPVKAKDAKIKYVGSLDKLIASDLFIGTVPAGAELRIFGNVGADDDYMNPDRGLLPESLGTNTLMVAENTIEDFDLTKEIQFTGTRTDVVYLALFHNGVRISDDIILEVYAANNVRTYAEMVAKMNSGSTGVSDGYPLTDNIVFLSDITMDSTNNYFTIPSGTTVYGNTFDFDIKNGRLEEEGIINLKGTIRDVKIIGKTYPTFASSAGDEYGSSAINATGTAYIYNCYISNTRSPLRTSGTTTIEDTVLFGGRYSNIDMTGGSITIKGTVTTVQQLHSADGASNVIGVGVTGWFNDSKKTVNISEGANFVQYNFMDSNIKDYLPKVEVMGTEVIDLKLPFNTIFTDSDYTAYRYTATNGGVYANSGMIATDAYMLNYTVTGGDTSWEIKLPFGNFYYPVGYQKTVKLTTDVGDGEEFIVVHDTRFTPKDGTVISTNSVKLTGAQLKAGVIFELNEKIDFGAAVTEDGTNYYFQIQSDNYRTINVSGSGDYNHLTYKYDTDMSGKMYLADTALSLASMTLLGPRGLHYGKMEVDVHTPKSTATAVGTLTYQQLLEQYIAMGDYYTPDTFEFNANGTITNYWEK